MSQDDNIQYLTEKLRNKDGKIRDLKNEISELKSKLNASGKVGEKGGGDGGGGEIDELKKKNKELDEQLNSYKTKIAEVEQGKRSVEILHSNMMNESVRSKEVIDTLLQDVHRITGERFRNTDELLDWIKYFKKNPNHGGSGDLPFTRNEPGGGGMKNKVMEMTQKLQTLQSRYEDLEMESEATERRWQKQMKKKEDEFKELKEEMEENQNKKPDKSNKKKLKELKDMQTELEDKIEEMEREILKKDRKLKEYEEIVENSRRKIGNLEDEIKKKNEILEKEEKNGRETMLEMENFKTEVDKLKKESVTVINELEVKRKAMETLRNKLKVAEEKISELNKDLNKCQKEVKEETEKYEYLNGLYNNAKAKATSNEEKALHLEQQLGKLKRDDYKQKLTRKPSVSDPDWWSRHQKEGLKPVELREPKQIVKPSSGRRAHPETNIKVCPSCSEAFPEHELPTHIVECIDN